MELPYFFPSLPVTDVWFAILTVDIHSDFLVISLIVDCCAVSGDISKARD